MASIEHQFQVKPVVKVPCPLCLDAHLPRPFLFSWTELESKFAQKEVEIICNREPDVPHHIQISDIAPDLAMLDFDSRLVDIDHEVEMGKVTFSKKPFFFSYSSHRNWAKEVSLLFTLELLIDNRSQ